MKVILQIFLIFIFSISRGQEKNLFFFENKNSTPAIQLKRTDTLIANAISFFRVKIKERYDIDMEFIKKSKLGVINISFDLLKQGDKEKKKYEIFFDGTHLIIKAKNTEGFKEAIAVLIYNILEKDSLGRVLIPRKMDISKSENNFEYREVYFSNNFDLLNQEENHTHHLEAEWKLWGIICPNGLKKIKYRIVFML